MSSGWCRHAEKFVESSIKRLDLDSSSLVIELASNDGYLLQYVKKAGVACLGVEPTKATADTARNKGIETIEKFFTYELSKELPKADLVVANNVLAHVPDINDFVRGITNILKATGIVSFEFPHLVNLVKHNQFDTIYHEHYSYLSLSTTKRILATAGLYIYDVEVLATHGGSLRVWAGIDKDRGMSKSACDILVEEDKMRLESLEIYDSFQERAILAKLNLLTYLIEARKSGKKVIGYGAAAKGNTMLNYAGVSIDLLEAVADLSPGKQDMYLPGSHIPVVHPDHLDEYRPDELLVLPWNLIDEVRSLYPKKRTTVYIPELKTYPALNG